MFSSACKKLECIKGKVFVRYTVYTVVLVQIAKQIITELYIWDSLTRA